MAVTTDAPVKALAKFQFTPRQAGFLVLVMRHAGVCLDRQYCAYARVAHGKATQEFFATLVRRGFATAYSCGSNRAWIYHVHHKALYGAIGEPNNRYRRPAFLGRAVERLMILDAILLDRTRTWLATEREKVAHFSVRLQGQLKRDELPSLTFRGKTASTVRYFPDKLPIGVDATGDHYVFLYLVTRAVPIDFRAFLHRHAELFLALRAWTLRLLVPRHLKEVAPIYQHAFGEEFTSPLRPTVIDELRWYFQHRSRGGVQAARALEARYRRADRAFAAPRFRALYRAWIARGDRVLDGARSPALEDAVTRERGRMECYVLPHVYHHLLPLVGTA
jgi:hypothetical protein